MTANASLCPVVLVVDARDVGAFIRAGLLTAIYGRRAVEFGPFRRVPPESR